MYDVLLSPDAQKVYQKASRALAKKIARCLMQLEQNPQIHPNIKALKGELAGYHRYRLGNYRVLYIINNQEAKVWVVAIAHRSKVYKP
ncbi:MAG: type II toxin-antitoxin system RelE family toxin [Spirulinaceae cyanobacterium]